MGEASKLGVQLGDLRFPYFLKFSRSQIWIYLDLSHGIAPPFVDLVVIFVWGGGIGSSACTSWEIDMFDEDEDGLLGVGRDRYLQG